MEEIINIIISAISTVGFPIAAFCAMWYLNYKTTNAINDLNLTVSKNTEAIENLQAEFKALKNK